MLLAMLKEKQPDEPFTTLHITDQEYASMSALKKHMRSHPEGFVLGERYTLVERKPIVSISPTKQVTITEGGTL